MNAEKLWKMQGWIQMIMMNFNEEAGDLNFLPSCHNCSMIVHEPGKTGPQVLSRENKQELREIESSVLQNTHNLL